MASAAHAATRRSGAGGAFFGAPQARRGEVCAVLRGAGPTSGARAILHATPAAIRLRLAAAIVVARRPASGTSEKAASAAPTAPPAVLTTYRPPAGVPARAGSSTNQAAATGKVAPMAIAGTTSTRRLVTIRSAANSSPGASEPYAAARTGLKARSASGTPMPDTAIASSRAAYVRSAARGVRRAATWPPASAPSARPPRNAASTVLTAATVWPRCSVSRRVQTTS
jgi:hypothetical protein